MDSALRGSLSGPGAVPPPAARRTLLAIGGLGCGVSPAFYGYFDLSLWGPIGIGLAVLAAALLLAGRSLPRGLAAVAVAALLAFAAWCLLSTAWAESGDRALTEGDRWVVYGLYLLVVLLLLVDRRDVEVLLGSAVFGILGVAGYDLIRMLDGHGRELFSGSRLLEPLGYVNGMGGFFLLGLWPLLAVAERARRPLLAGAAAGAATVLAALVLLTDSRGTAFAFVVSALAVSALLPGRRRRAWLVLVLLAGLLFAWGPLTDVTREVPGVAAQAATTVQRGAEWALLAGVCVGVLWSVASAATASLAGRSEATRRWSRQASDVLLGAVAVAVVVAAAVAIHDPAGRISSQYRAFTELKPVKGESRFTSGGGNRYDYWRIAWRQFADHPLDGVGAGNFDRTYYLERRTNEDVHQAHSIELQTLGDTGLVGAVLLAAFFAAALVAAWRLATAAHRREAAAGVAVAATGTFAVWLAQTSVDWLHLIPGLTGVALGAAAVLLRGPTRGQPGSIRLAKPALLAVVPLAIAAIVLIGRPTISEHLRSEAREQLRSDPRAALGAAEESLSLNPDSLQGHYLKAASLARLHAFVPARKELEEAIGREPHSYVSWALLGDLLTRRGSIAAAMRAYRRASLLNPRERELRRLADSRSLLERLHDHPGR